jgi:hypothetical protein
LALSVAEDVLDRELTEQELVVLEQHFMKIGLPDWYEKIHNAILTIVKK